MFTALKRTWLVAAAAIGLTLPAQAAEETKVALGSGISYYYDFGNGNQAAVTPQKWGGAALVTGETAYNFKYKSNGSHIGTAGPCKKANFGDAISGGGNATRVFNTAMPWLMPTSKDKGYTIACWAMRDWSSANLPAVLAANCGTLPDNAVGAVALDKLTAVPTTNVGWGFFFANEPKQPVLRFSMTTDGAAFSHYVITGKPNTMTVGQAATDWHHYAMTIARGATEDAVIFYVDGVEQGRQAVAKGSFMAAPKTDGGFFMNTADGGQGQQNVQDDFAMWERTLSAEEIELVGKNAQPLSVIAILPPKTSDKKVISLNFGSEKGAVGAAVTGLEFVGNWNDLGGNGENVALKDSTGAAGVASVTYSCPNLWTYGATDVFLKGYLDDGGNAGRVTVKGIPYPTYDVIVYYATDTASNQFNPASVNGVYYTYDAANPAVAKVGAAGRNNVANKFGATQQAVAAYGKNALRVVEQSGDLVILGAGNANSARGGIAAIQIVDSLVEIKVIEKPFTASATWSTLVAGEMISKKDVVQLNAADAAGELVLTLDGTIELRSLKIVGLQPLTINTTSDFVDQIRGLDLSEYVGEVTINWQPQGGNLNGYEPQRVDTSMVSTLDPAAFRIREGGNLIFANTTGQNLPIHNKTITVEPTDVEGDYAAISLKNVSNVSPSISLTGTTLNGTGVFALVGKVGDGNARLNMTVDLADTSTFKGDFYSVNAWNRPVDTKLTGKGLKDATFIFGKDYFGKNPPPGTKIDSDTLQLTGDATLAGIKTSRATDVIKSSDANVRTLTLTGAETYRASKTEGTISLVWAGTGAQTFTAVSALADLTIGANAGALSYPFEGGVTVAGKLTIEKPLSADEATITGQLKLGAESVIQLPESAQVGVAYKLATSLSLSGTPAVTVGKALAKVVSFDNTNGTLTITEMATLIPPLVVTIPDAATEANWSELMWTDSAAKPHVIKPEDWAEYRGDVVITAHNSALLNLTLDQAMTIKTVTFAESDAAVTLTLKPETTISVDSYDFAATTGAITVGFDVGDAAVLAGARTIFPTTPTSNNITLGLDQVVELDGEAALTKENTWAHNQDGLVHFASETAAQSIDLTDQAGLKTRYRFTGDGVKTFKSNFDTNSVTTTNMSEGKPFIEVKSSTLSMHARNLFGWGNGYFANGVIKLDGTADKPARIIYEPVESFTECMSGRWVMAGYADIVSNHTELGKFRIKQTGSAEQPNIKVLKDGVATITPGTNGMSIHGAETAFVEVQENASLVFKGAIGGFEGNDGKITKTGAGRLTFEGVNTVGGLLNVLTGEVAFKDLAKWGAGTTLAAGTTLIIDQTRTDAMVIWNKAIAGVGDVVKTGAGSIIMTANNLYSGATMITEGSVTMTGNSLSTAVSIAEKATLRVVPLQIFNKQVAAATAENFKTATVAAPTGDVTPTMVGLDQLHRNANPGTNVLAANSVLEITGSFVVPADQAGIYTFAGNWDDRLAFWIDDAEVFTTESATLVGVAKPINLTAGSHTFKIRTLQLGGALGTYVADWRAKEMALGYFKGETTEVTAATYTKFDPTIPGALTQITGQDVAAVTYEAPTAVNGTFAASTARPTITAVGTKATITFAPTADELTIDLVRFPTTLAEGTPIDAASFVTTDETFEISSVKVLAGYIYVNGKNQSGFLPPFIATITQDAAWSTLVWTDAAGTEIPQDYDWAEYTAELTLKATNSAPATMTLDEAPASTIVAVTGDGALTLAKDEALTLTTVETYDMTKATGDVTFAFSTGDATVLAGTNTILTQSAPGRLVIEEGAKASFDGDVTMGSYDNKGVVHKLGDYTGGPVAPATVEYDTATLTVNQDQNRTVRTNEHSDISLTGDNSARTAWSFDVRGGIVKTPVSGTPTWFGANGRTKVSVSAGEFLARTTNSATTGSQGFLLGYTGTAGGTLPVTLSGTGKFRVPEGSLIFWNSSVAITLADTALLEAKGIFKGGNTGAVTTADQSTVMVGSLGIGADAATLTANGGLWTQQAGHSTTINPALALGADTTTTLAADADQSITLAGAITGEGNLTIGTATKTGSVILSGATSFKALTATAGRLTLSKAATFTLMTVKSGATLSLTQDYTGTGAIAVEGGATLDLGALKALPETNVTVAPTAIVDLNQKRATVASWMLTGKLHFTPTNAEVKAGEVRFIVSADVTTAPALDHFVSSVSIFEVGEVILNGTTLILKRGGEFYMSPFKATATADANWTALTWTDSSATPKTVKSTYWANLDDANLDIELTVNGARTITMDAPFDANFLTVKGSGSLVLTGTAAVGIKKLTANVPTTFTNNKINPSIIISGTSDITLTGTGVGLVRVGHTGKIILDGIQLTNMAGGTMGIPLTIGAKGATLHANSSAWLITGKLSGSGLLTLVNDGNGILCIQNNTNDFAGNVLVKQGLVIVGANATAGGGAASKLGTTATTITIADGASFKTHLGTGTAEAPAVYEPAFRIQPGGTLGNIDGFVNYTGNIVINDGGNADSVANYTYYWAKQNVFSGIVSGQGVLRIAAGDEPGVSTLKLANTANTFTGTYRLAGTTANAFKLIMDKQNSVGKPSIDFETTSNTLTLGQDIALDSLTGQAGTIDYASHALSVERGDISALTNVTLAKVGTGTLIVGEKRPTLRGASVSGVIQFTPTDNEPMRVTFPATGFTAGTGAVVANFKPSIDTWNLATVKVTATEIVLTVASTERTWKTPAVGIDPAWLNGVPGFVDGDSVIFPDNGRLVDPTAGPEPVWMTKATSMLSMAVTGSYSMTLADTMTTTIATVGNEAGDPGYLQLKTKRHAYRYVRLSLLARSTTGTATGPVALSEFGLFLGDKRINQGAQITVSDGKGTVGANDDTDPTRLVDGRTAGDGTKWMWTPPGGLVNFTDCFLTCDAGEGQTFAFDSYQLGMTDSTGRNPTQWQLLGSQDNQTWVEIDSRTYTNQQANRWAVNDWLPVMTPRFMGNISLLGDYTLLAVNNVAIDGNLSLGANTGIDLHAGDTLEVSGVVAATSPILLVGASDEKAYMPFLKTRAEGLTFKLLDENWADASDGYHVDYRDGQYFLISENSAGTYAMPYQATVDPVNRWSDLVWTDANGVVLPENFLAYLDAQGDKISRQLNVPQGAQLSLDRVVTMESLTVVGDGELSIAGEKLTVTGALDVKANFSAATETLSYGAIAIAANKVFTYRNNATWDFTSVAGEGIFKKTGSGEMRFFADRTMDNVAIDVAEGLLGFQTDNVYNNKFDITIRKDAKATLTKASAAINNMASVLTLDGGSEFVFNNGNVANGAKIKCQVVVNATDAEPVLFKGSINGNGTDLTNRISGQGTLTLANDGTNNNIYSITGEIADRADKPLKLIMHDGNGVTLTANNTFTGGLLVKTNTLSVKPGSVGRGDVTVESGATLAVTEASSSRAAILTGKTLSGAGTVTGPCEFAADAKLAGTLTIDNALFGESLVLVNEAAVLTTFKDITLLKGKTALTLTTPVTEKTRVLAWAADSAVAAKADILATTITARGYLVETSDLGLFLTPAPVQEDFISVDGDVSEEVLAFLNGMTGAPTTPTTITADQAVLLYVFDAATWPADLSALSFGVTALELDDTGKVVITATPTGFTPGATLQGTVALYASYDLTKLDTAEALVREAKPTITDGKLTFEPLAFGNNRFTKIKLSIQ